MNEDLNIEKWVEKSIQNMLDTEDKEMASRLKFEETFSDYLVIHCLANDNCKDSK